jgi:hypothetical protein
MYLALYFLKNNHSVLFTVMYVREPWVRDVNENRLDFGICRGQQGVKPFIVRDIFDNVDFHRSL